MPVKEIHKRTRNLHQRLKTALSLIAVSIASTRLLMPTQALAGPPTSASATLPNSMDPFALAYNITTQQIGDHYYLFVADQGSEAGGSGTQIFDITGITSGFFPTSASATLPNSMDSSSFAYNITTQQIGDRYYLFVADNGSGAGGSGTQIFDITGITSGSFPASASATLPNSMDVNAKAIGVTTQLIGDRYYLFVADAGSGGGSGTQIFDITGITSGSFPPSASATLPNSMDSIAQAIGVTTQKIGDRYYLFVADAGSPGGGSGTQIFDITGITSGSFPTSASATLPNSMDLNAKALGITTQQIGDRYYLFVADVGSAPGGSGTQIFDITGITSGFFPTSASATLPNSMDADALAVSVTTQLIGNHYYLFVADNGSPGGGSGTQIFDITGIASGSFPTSASATLPNSMDSIASALGITTQQIGNRYYLFVADNGSPGGGSGTQIFDITDLASTSPPPPPPAPSGGTNLPSNPLYKGFNATHPGGALW